MNRSVQKKILIAVDGSEQAMEAVRYVGGMLPSAGTEIVLLHVMTKVPESFWDLEKEPGFNYRIANIGVWEAQQEKMVQDFMARAKATIADAGIPVENVTDRIHPRKAGISRDIIAESYNGYDAVVVGRTGLSDLKDLVLGSIADKLIGKLSHVPIWVIGGKSHSGKLLIPIDASEGAMQAVEYVGSMVGGSESAEVTLFHAVRGLDVFVQGVGDAFIMTQQKEWAERARQEIEHAAQEIEPVMQDAESRLLKSGFSPARVHRKIAKGVGSRAGSIVEEAMRAGHDTIVMGRRGLSRIQEFFIGRVSNKVVHMARNKAIWVVS